MWMTFSLKETRGRKEVNQKIQDVCHRYVCVLRSIAKMDDYKPPDHLHLTNNFTG